MLSIQNNKQKQHIHSFQNQAGKHEACSFCHKKKETIEHLPWYCNHSQFFLDYFEHNLNNKTNLR